MTSPEGAVRLDGVGIVKRFGGLTAVDDVTVTVAGGEVAALIGPNGAGKTTLFQCLTGADQPDGGRVLLDGRDITTATPDARARMGIGRTFQRLAVFPTMSVVDNLKVGAEHHDPDPAILRVGTILGAVLGFPVYNERRHARRVEDVVQRLGLAELRDRPAAELPTGTLRLVELGRALCHEPRVLLLDEPASGLNTDETRHLQSIIRQVADSGVAVLLVEHDVDLVFGVADRVYAMAEGRLIAAGDPAQVRADPAVLEAYLDPADADRPGAPDSTVPS